MNASGSSVFLVVALAFGCEPSASRPSPILRPNLPPMLTPTAVVTVAAPTASISVAAPPEPPLQPEVAEPTKPSPLARGNGTPADAKLKEGDELFDAGKYKEAESAYRKAIALAPNDPAPVVGAVRARLAKDEVPVDFGTGKTNKTLAAAIAELKRALKLDADSYAPVHLELGRALLVQGKADPALESLRKAVTIDPREAEAHSALGVGLLAIGDKKAAVAALVRAAELEPRSPSRHSNAGTALMASGDVAAAIKAYERALRLAPNDPGTLSDLGTAYLASNDVEAALTHLAKAMQLAPDNAAIVSNLGYAHRMKGDFAKAEESFEAALKLDPELVSAWVNLGSVQAIRGDFAKARASLERARAIDADDPRVVANLAELDELEKGPKK